MGTTVLHVLSQFSDSSFAVQQLLQINPNLLLKRNKKKETSLHIASRKGHLNFFKAVTQRMKNNIRCTLILGHKDVNGNTALNEAMKNNHQDIFKCLLRKIQVWHLSRIPRTRAFCMLLLRKEMKMLLGWFYQAPNIFLPFYTGPGGRTALHAAAMWNFPSRSDFLSLIPQPNCYYIIWCSMIAGTAQCLMRPKKNFEIEIFWLFYNKKIK